MDCLEWVLTRAGGLQHRVPAESMGVGSHLLDGAGLHHGKRTDMGQAEEKRFAELKVAAKQRAIEVKAQDIANVTWAPAGL